MAGGSHAAACTGTGTDGGEVQAAKVPTAVGSALCAGTAEEPDGESQQDDAGVGKGNRSEHPRRTISGRGVFTDISHTRGDTKRCSNSAAAENPLYISQTFPTSITKMSLGFEGFNVRCQSKQTQHIPENNAAHFCLGR